MLTYECGKPLATDDKLRTNVMFRDYLTILKTNVLIFVISLFYLSAALAQNVDEGIELFYAEKYEDAKEIFERILQSNSNDSTAHFFLGQIYFSLGRHDDALKVFGESRCAGGWQYRLPSHASKCL